MTTQPLQGKTKMTSSSKVPLVATADEVYELQEIRDLRLAGKTYKSKKTAWFKAFRARYGITYPGKIKVETENEALLGKVQYCSNNMPLKVDAELIQQVQNASNHSA